MYKPQQPDGNNAWRVLITFQRHDEDGNPQIGGGCLIFLDDMPRELELISVKNLRSSLEKVGFPYPSMGIILNAMEDGHNGIKLWNYSRTAYVELHRFNTTHAAGVKSRKISYKKRTAAEMNIPENVPMPPHIARRVGQ